MSYHVGIGDDSIDQDGDWNDPQTDHRGDGYSPHLEGASGLGGDLLLDGVGKADLKRVHLDTKNRTKVASMTRCTGDGRGR